MTERNSRQRNEILRTVRAARNHPTAQDVFHAVRQQLPHVSLATVYRNLVRLVERGELRAVHADRLAVRYEGVLDDHGHFACRSCGVIADLSPRIAPEGRELLEEQGYSVSHTTITVYGTCPACSPQKRSA